MAVIAEEGALASPTREGTTRPPLRLDTKILYGMGAAATGIKTRSFASFLMLFYNQGLGMSAAVVASAIAIVTMLDSFFDPLIGQASDNFRSRWGRRHPFMYVGIIPTSVAFFFIWSPPALEGGALFAFLVAMLVVVRLFDTFFELPAVALSAELTDEYNGRTVLLSLRKAFEMAAGMLIVIAGLQYFMKEDAAGGGIIAREGYAAYGATAAALIFLTMLVSAIGTHGQIRWLKQPPARRMTVVGMLREMGQSLNNRACMIIMGVGLFYSVCLGVRQAMEMYFYVYFWELTQGQIATLTAISVPSALAGVALAPVVSHRIGKRLGTLMVWIPAMVVILAFPLLRVWEILPQNGDPKLFPLILVETILVQVLLMTASVLVPAMLADVVEESEVRTGRRAEGLLFSADNLFRKFVSGIGVSVSGLILTAVAFPDDAVRGQVDEAVLIDMALIFVPAVALFFLAAILLVALFPIDRARHEQNVRALQARAAAQPNAD